MRFNALSRRGLLFGGIASFAAPAVSAAALIATPRQSEGPFYPDRLPLDRDNDLIGTTPGRARGTVTHVFGRVSDVQGRPLAGARVEIWQCDALGRYIHSADRNRGPRDATFQGYGLVDCDSDGGYRFRTIKPVPYGRRAPHIHFAVKARGFQTLITQLYMAEAPENRGDGLLSRLSDPAQRAALVVPFRPAPELESGALAARFDIVLA